METAENALQAYKTGDIDALTNFHFEPLALKLLKPFDEFHRTKHSAINVYEFNLNQKPFDDVRVREALAISIDRERLTEDEMDGATEPAFAFSLFNSSRPFRQNVEKARKLFSAASFENGENFPVIRLIVNRNDTQKRVAKAVAAMWKKNLNVNTEIIVKENADFETAKNTGEFDLIRRGVVLPTTNESANMPAIFPPKTQPEKIEELAEVSNSNAANFNVNAANTTVTNSNVNSSVDANSNSVENNQIETEQIIEAKPILNEAQAIAEIPSIPLYYPKSYSLVKPYIQGFETNVLDAPSLKTVKIDENWQTNRQKEATKTLQSVF
jgi:oligopeptide transport system substrate-binding protein